MQRWLKKIMIHPCRDISTEERKLKVALLGLIGVLGFLLLVYFWIFRPDKDSEVDTKEWEEFVEYQKKYLENRFKERDHRDE